MIKGGEVYATVQPCARSKRPSFSFPLGLQLTPPTAKASSTAAATTSLYVAPHPFFTPNSFSHQQRSTHKDDCGSKYCIWSNRHAQNCPHCPQCSRVRFLFPTSFFSPSHPLTSSSAPTPKRSFSPGYPTTAGPAPTGGRKTMPTVARIDRRTTPIS